MGGLLTRGHGNGQCHEEETHGGVESGAFFKLLISGVLTQLVRRLILGARTRVWGFR